MTRQIPRLVLRVAATSFFWSTFPSPAPAADFPVGTNPSSVVVGDFNGDGKQDLAVANNRSDNISVLLGNGDGTFQPAANYAAGACSGPNHRSFPWSVAVVDFDGEQEPDLAVATSSCPTLPVLLGQAYGTVKHGRASR